LTILIEQLLDALSAGVSSLNGEDILDCMPLKHILVNAEKIDHISIPQASELSIYASLLLKRLALWE